MLLAIMDNNEIILVKLNGKDYSGWSLHLKQLVTGKCLGGYLERTIKETDKTKETWNQNNSKVVTWILSSVDPSFSL